MSSISEHAGHTNGGRSLSSDGHDDDAIRQARPVSLIFKRELLKRVPLSFPTIWKMMREGRFPRARIIGGKSAWLESEIDQFLTDLPVRPYKE
jgi:predicted DNA-binding transcriptional regulator AlpA